MDKSTPAIGHTEAAANQAPDEQTGTLARWAWLYRQAASTLTNSSARSTEGTETGDPKSSSGAAPKGALFSSPERLAGTAIDNEVPDAVPAGLIVSKGAAEGAKAAGQELWPETAGASVPPSIELPPRILASMDTTNPLPAVTELAAADGNPGFTSNAWDPGASSFDSDLAPAAAAPRGVKLAAALPAPTSAGLHINLIADANNVNAPAGWAAAIQQAASIIEQNFSDPVTINLRYGYASFRNVVDPSLNGSGGAYANTDNGTFGNYNTVTGWLLGDRTTADDFNSYDALPSSSASFPGGANNFYVPNAELRALGQLGNNSTIDGSAAFGTGISLSNLVPVAIHELTHAMGRITLHYSPSTTPVIADWFRYDSAGHFQWTEGDSSAFPSYFSIDGGTTDIADFGQTSDYSDFLNSGVQGGVDPFNEFYSDSTLHSLTTADLREMDVLGFNRIDDFVENPTTTGAVAVNSSATGAINPAGEQDWFAVNLTAGTRYRFNENGSPSGAGTLSDTYLRLFDGSSNLLTQGDDSYTVNADSPTFVFDSQFFYTPTTSGTYYVSAGAFSSNTGTYTIHVTPDDYASDPNTTGTVSVGGSSTGSIDTSGDRDWFAVSLTAGSSYHFALQGNDSGQGTLADPYLELRDSGGTVITFDDDNGIGFDSLIDYTASSSDTYYLTTRSFSTSGTGTYTLAFSASVNPPPPPVISTLAVAANNGVLGDRMTAGGTGEAGATITLLDGTTTIGTVGVAANGTWTLTTASPLSGGSHTLTATQTDSGGPSPPSAALQLQITLAATNAVTFFGRSLLTDQFTGGAGNDIFQFATAALESTDTVAGGLGSDTLQLTTGGTINAAGVSGVETYTLASTAANTLTLANANFTNVTGAAITVNGGTAGNSVNGSALTGAIRITFVGGAGVDNASGGAGNDLFKFTAAALANTDTVAGGLGSDTLQLTTGGTINAAGVSGVETYTLASTAANTLTLANANFTNVTGAAITVNGGTAGNSVNGSALTGANRITFVGGAGVDNASGGAGNDLFKFTAAALANTDTVAGGLGSDTLQLTTGGTINAAGVSGVETYTLASTAANTLTLANANFTNVTGAAITVNGGTAGNSVNGSALTGANRITFVGGAGVDNASGGAGNDLFKFTAAALANTDTVAGGLGSDTLQLTTGGTINAAGVSGVETYTLASTAANTLTLANANFTNVTGAAITVNGGTAGNTVNGSALTGANRITFVGGAGVDNANGGAGNDLFKFTAAALANTDTVAGGLGSDTLQMTTGGTINAAGVSGVETYTLASTAANTLTLANANFTNVTGAAITVNGGTAGNSVNGSALTGANRITFVGGAGVDNANGGAGNDLFKFTAAALANTDTVAGGLGSDTLQLTTGGTINAAGVSGVETYTLASTAANTLTLANANFTNVTGAAITVNGGTAGNTVNGSALTGANQLMFQGSTGNDIMRAGSSAVLTGSGGNNQFTFSDIGTHTINDFGVSAGNALVLKDTGFNLGSVNEGHGTAVLQHLDSSEFVSNATGSFTTSGQRFAYDTTNGIFYYDPDGSGGGSTRQAVATLIDHASLSAGATGDLYFII